MDAVLRDYEEKATSCVWRRLLVSEAPDTLSLFRVLTATCCWEDRIYSSNDCSGLPSTSLPVGIDRHYVRGKSEGHAELGLSVCLCLVSKMPGQEEILKGLTEL